MANQSDLQLEEALAASLSLLPSSSSPQPSTLVPPVDFVSPSFASLQSVGLSNLQRELKDRKLSSKAEARCVREEPHCRIHDRKLAAEIMTILDNDRDECGDVIRQRFGEDSSNDRGSGNANGEGSSMDRDGDMFSLYCKGIVSNVTLEGQEECNSIIARVGFSIFDSQGNLMCEMKKELPSQGPSMSKVEAEALALIKGLEAASASKLNRISIYCHYYPLHQFITSEWTPRQRKVAALVDQVKLLKSEFEECKVEWVEKNEVKFAFKLAEDEITSQTVRRAESVASKDSKETCVICLEDTDVSQIFAVDRCLHRYCFSCMNQHVEGKLFHGLVPMCPHEGCKSNLNVSSCSKFLPPELTELMNRRLEEASIPVTDRIYCPYPTCSALMSKAEVSEDSTTSALEVPRSGERKCKKCHALFCINCKVPWHSSLTCSDYERLHPNPPAEDLKLKSLASEKQWPMCGKCENMIELSEGCRHMTCRCGYEFCYNCGAEWKNKKPTCSCPLWEDDDDDGSDNNDDDQDHDGKGYDDNGLHFNSDVEYFF